MVRLILYLACVGISVAQICPPAEVLSPCTCRPGSRGTASIECFDIGSYYDLKGILNNASQFVDEDFVFNGLSILGCTELLELEDDTIGHLKFSQISIVMNDNLRYIAPRAFNASRDVSSEVYLSRNRMNGSTIFDVISNLQNLSTLTISNDGISSIPDRAFQNNPFLQEAEFDATGITSIGSKAFATGGDNVLRTILLDGSRISSEGLAEDAFGGISPSPSLSVRFINAKIDFLEQKRFQTLLDNARSVEVGGQNCFSSVDSTCRFHCDERADWICDNETAYRPKLQGFLCKTESGFEDVWEYCAAKNSTTICPPAEVIHPCTCSAEETNALTCHNINGEFNLKEILDSASQFVDDNVVFQTLNISSTSIRDIEDSGNLKFEEIILFDNRNLAYISPLVFSSSKDITNRLILDSNRIGNEAPRETDIFDFINSFKNLNVLQISHNLLKSMTDSAIKNPQLNNLTMMNNRISTIGSRAFAGAPNLDQINLSYNQLTLEDVSEDAFEGISRSVSHIDMECNHGLEFMDQKIFQNLLDRVGLVRKNDLPALPQSVQDLVIPDKFQKTITGSQFLRYDSGPTSQRMLVFTTDENLQLLNQSSQWFMDGTFKTSPSIFQQLYTVHGCVNGKVVPMVYALLTNKSQQGYEDLLRQIKLLKPGISPTQFLLDFEHAAVNAVRSEFPLAQLRGCFFHFQQSIWRHIQQVASISASYRSDPDFALQMRRLPALAFRKVADARTSYLELVRGPFFMTVEMLEFLEYFERTWIGQPPIGNRTWWTDPIFPLELWNCFEAVNHGWARTNNSVEGWHSRFQSLVGIAHPNIYAFITCLQKEEDMTRQTVANLSSGGTPRQPNARYLRLNERLQRIVADYNNLSILSYLKKIATNLAFV